MNTRSNTVGTALPHPTRHARALPTSAGHGQDRDDAPPRTRGSNPAPASASEETTRRPCDHLLSPEDPTMDVKPTAAKPGVNRDDPRRADLAQEDPLVQANDARLRDTLHQRLSVGHAGGKRR